MSKESDIIREALTDHLGDAFYCTRVWTAWQYGTMSDDDFVLVNDTIDEIVDTIVSKLEANRIG